MEFWLYDGTNTLDLGLYVQDLEFGSNTRSFKINNFAGSPGGQIRGFGTPGTKKITFKRIEKAELTDNNFFNSRRNDFMSWFTRPVTDEIYLYVRNGENTFTVRSRVYCTMIGSEQITYQRITASLKTYEIISPSGIFTNITAVTGSEAITGSTQQTKAITNSGLWECPITLEFTPTANETFFQVIYKDNFGITLQGNFLAGNKISYNTADNSLTIAGNEVQTSQYLTSGNVFNLPPGANTLYIRCSGAGLFEYSFNEVYT